MTDKILGKITKAVGTAMIEFIQVAQEEDIANGDSRPILRPTGRIKCGDRWVILCSDCLEKVCPG